MNRKNFFRKLMITSAGISIVPNLIKGETNKKTASTDLNEQVGFNHIPVKEEKKMNTVLHKAASRGNADHGWLNSHHTFSFANYYNPERMNFGVLRVLNDDVVAPGMGFGTHPHENMEIISIPLEGDLEHKDSMGNVAVIKEGDIQVMSAGKGIYHSEYNLNKEKQVKFLQIWVFPNKRNVEPRYDQITLKQTNLKNKFYQILSPNADDDGVWIHQNAWFHLGNFEKGNKQSYHLKKSGNGIYVFILKGSAVIGENVLEERDGLGIWETSEIEMEATSDTKILLMEVPMDV